MQKIRFIQSGKIEIVDNNTAHSLIERGVADIVHEVGQKQAKNTKNKMQKKYRNKGI